MILPVLLMSGLAATADPAQGALDQALAAAQARTAQATAEHQWQDERERLEALVATAEAEAARATAAATAAQAQAEAARRVEAGPLVTSAVAEVLATAARRQRAVLEDLARRLPPGAVAVPAEATSDAVAVALAASERAAGQVTVEVVSGDLKGVSTAAQVLRVAGARAWWLSLDGRTGGVVQITPAGLVFQPVTDPGPIAAALASLTGRAGPAFVVLPEAP